MAQISILTCSIHMSSYPYRGPNFNYDFVTSSILLRMSALMKLRTQLPNLVEIIPVRETGLAPPLPNAAPDILGNKNLSANEIHTSEISRPLKSNNEPKTKSTVPVCHQHRAMKGVGPPKSQKLGAQYPPPPHSSGKITKL